MDRNKSSNLSEQQADGNLGNEHVRNSSNESSPRRNRKGESSSSEDRWNPGGESREESERTDGSER